MSKKADNELLIETATTVKLMNERLFGDGSADAGALAKLYTMLEKHNDAAIQALKDHAVEDTTNFKTVADSVADVKMKLNWYAGGIAAVGAVGTLILGALSIHFAAVATAARLAAIK